jgi:cyclomaltodextrin glucanotransferase
MVVSTPDGYAPVSAHQLFEQEAEFRKETIYFIVIDRFFNGDRANDGVSKKGLYDPSRSQWGHYWGGDLEGIIAKADYLKQLGITAVWLSPLFEQVDAIEHGHGPMHGYWTKDFKRVNPHFVKLGDATSVKSCDTLRRMVDALHERGIKIVLDIVCNHSSPELNGSKGVVTDDGEPLADFHQDINGFYYHYPGINDWDDEFQLIHHEMLGLATFNESNINFRNYIKSAIKAWLDLGFDALRIDTLKHMPVWFWQEFVADIQAHKPDTFLFGEYGFGSPWDGRYLNYANNTGVSVLDFALAGAIRSAFSGHEPGGFHLIERVLAMDPVYRRSTALVTFIENHDMPRFLSICPSHGDLELATVLLLTLRGIPCLFYGTEQYLVNDSDGGHDPYNRPMMDAWETGTRLSGIIRTLASLRKSNRALSYGRHGQKYISDGLYAFTRRYRENRVFVIVNKGDFASLDIEHSDLPDGPHTCLLTGQHVVVEQGAVRQLSIQGKGACVLAVQGEPLKATTVVKFQINDYITHPGEVMAVCGDAPELGAWDVDFCPKLEYINGDVWFAEVGFHESAGRPIRFKFVVLRPSGQQPVFENLVCRTFLLPRGGSVKLDLDWDRQ